MSSQKAIFKFGSTNSQFRPMLSVEATYTRMKETYYDFNTLAFDKEEYSGIGFVSGAGLNYLMASLEFLITSNPDWL